MSDEHKKYLSSIKKRKIIIHSIQISILLLFFITWELLARFNVIDSFITSSPSRILNTLINLYNNNNLFNHIYATCYEVIVSFIICFILSLTLSIILYSNNFLRKVLDPYIIMLNGLPKVAFGPLLIIWLGIKTKTIIVNSLLISVIISTITILNGMLTTNKSHLKLFDIFKSSKIDKLRYLIIPSSKSFIISSLKINLSMNLVGVIMGEFLCSKEGIGYLILYGTQVFDLSLVMCGILLLSILSIILMLIINLIEHLTK